MSLANWSSFTEESNSETVLQLMESIVSRCDEGVFGNFHSSCLISLDWRCITTDEDRFTCFQTKGIDLLLNKELDVSSLNTYISFFKYAFRVSTCSCSDY